MDEFTARIHVLESDKLDLQTKIKQMETSKLQDDHLKSRIEQDCKDLIRTNVELKNKLDDSVSRGAKDLAQIEEKRAKTREQIEEDERVRNELGRVQDDFQMLKIAMDMKEKQSTELIQSVKALEHDMHKRKHLFYEIKMMFNTEK